MITELKSWDGGNDLEWLADGQAVRARFATAVRSAVVLRDGTGVAVVLQAPAGVVDAALILAPDGKERARISAPSVAPESTSLDQMYYVLEELTLFVSVRGADWAHVVDEHSGRIIRSYETR